MYNYIEPTQRHNYFYKLKKMCIISGMDSNDVNYVYTLYKDTYTFAHVTVYYIRTVCTYSCLLHLYTTNRFVKRPHLSAEESLV